MKSRFSGNEKLALDVIFPIIGRSSPALQKQALPVPTCFSDSYEFMFVFCQ